MEFHKDIVITAIVCLAVMEIIALLKGINGQVFSFIAILIGALAGWVMPPPKLK